VGGSCRGILLTFHPPDPPRPPPHLPLHPHLPAREPCASPLPLTLPSRAQTPSLPSQDSSPHAQAHLRCLLSIEEIGHLIEQPFRQRTRGDRWWSKPEHANWRRRAEETWSAQVLRYGADDAKVNEAALAATPGIRDTVEAAVARAEMAPSAVPVGSGDAYSFGLPVDSLAARIRSEMSATASAFGLNLDSRPSIPP